MHPEYAGGAEDPKYGPQEIGEECIGWWSEIWDCGSGAREEGELREQEGVERLLEGDAWEGQELQEISGDMVRAAANSFKDGTAKGSCGWHPKVFNQWPETGLKAIAELLMLFERARR